MDELNLQIMYQRTEWHRQGGPPVINSQPRRLLTWILCSFLYKKHFLSREGKGRETNIYLGLTARCARGVHILDVFQPQCKPGVHDSLHCIQIRKAQPGKREPRYTNYIMYIHLTNINLLSPPGARRILNNLSLLKTKIRNLTHMTQRYEDFRKYKTPISVPQLRHQGLAIMPRIYKNELVVQNPYLCMKSIQDYALCVRATTSNMQQFNLNLNQLSQ